MKDNKEPKVKLVAYPQVSEEDFITLQDIASDKRTSSGMRLNAKLNIIMHNQAVLNYKLNKIL